MLQFICCHNFLGVVSPTRFSLEDIKNNKVYYKATQQEIGAESLQDTFNVTVSQGQLLINNKLTTDIIIQVSRTPDVTHSAMISSTTATLTNKNLVWHVVW